MHSIMKQTTSVTFMCIAMTMIAILSYLAYTGTLDYRQAFNWKPMTPCQTELQQLPLKVYMYDLPTKFNVGMLKKSKLTDGPPVTTEDLPPWPNNSGLKKQHSVEYWLMASLLYEGEDENGANREAVRVSDPDAADVFFVPFFSSLSFNTHGRNMTDPDTKYDKQLQADVLAVLKKSSHWEKSAGRDHVIPMHHPNAFRFFREEVNASILIVADFGRYTPKMSNLSKDVVAPYVHVVDSFLDDDVSDPYESRKTLLFFRGKTIRKQDGRIRAQLIRILGGIEDVIYETSDVSLETIKSSTVGMRSSKFCLHTAGDTPSSARLFDAIVSHCVPVIVSDYIELPYEDELDYNQFSIFFSFKEAKTKGFMVNQLRNISKTRWLEMWSNLKSISHHFEYQYPPRKDDAVNMIWRGVKHKLAAVNLAVHRSRRLKVPDWWR